MAAAKKVEKKVDSKAGVIKYRHDFKSYAEYDKYKGAKG